MTSRGICQSVGVSYRKGEHFPFLNKNGAHKNKAWAVVLHSKNATYIELLGPKTLLEQPENAELKSKTHN